MFAPHSIYMMKFETNWIKPGAAQPFFIKPRASSNTRAAVGRNPVNLTQDGISRRDVCNLIRAVIKYQSMKGAKFPRGISKLRALHTLRVVNVAWGNAMFQELRELTQLRKLGVTGVTKETSEKFWLAIVGHDQLQSLSVDFGETAYEDAVLDGCLGGNLWPPKCLESLKMCGRLVEVTEWIHGLQNLSRLQLKRTNLKQDAREAIGQLPNLAVLRVKNYSIEGTELRFPGPSFPSLLVLELNEYYLRSVEFEQVAMPKVEVLQATEECRNLRRVFGLHFLTSLTEIRLGNGDHKEMIQRALAEYPNSVTLKML
ncbi:hypothetical protein ACP70R_003869 [Stipagrostis hirtigluma subsp. patula]